MAKKNQEPEIRFTGFTDAWEQRKLNEVAEFSKGNGYSKNDLKDTGVPIILYGRLYTKYETVISEVDTYADERCGSIRSTGGEVVVPASGETAEEISRASVVERSGVLLGGDLNIVTPHAEIEPTFLALAISYGKPHKDMSKLAQGKSVVHLHNADLEKVELLYPAYEEQSAISTYFKQVDNLITLHQQKYDKLVVVKQSMLERMFPKDGANVPEVRFARFSDAWEQHEISEMYEKVREKNDLSYGTDRIISVANMYFKADAYISDEEYLRTYNIFKFGDIAFEGNKSRNFAHGRFVENTIGDGIVSHVFDVFRPIVKYDLLFWKYAINNERLMKTVLIRCTKASTMMTNLVASDFLNEKLQFPCLEEQERIGEFFDRLDNLITLHQRKLEKLKHIKDSMLERMFAQEV